VIGIVPLKKTTYRVRQSDPWYDDECRSAKRSARKLERRYKCTVKTSKQSPSVSALAQQAGETWLQKASHRLVEQKGRRFWRTEADNSANPSRLWQTIDAVLGRSKENNRTSLTPEDSFLHIKSCRRATQNAVRPAAPVP